MNAEGRVGWEEIADSRLEGSFGLEELNEVATLAHKSINRLSRKRPSMRDLVQALSNAIKARNCRSRRKKNLLPVTAEEEESAKQEPLPYPEHFREESIDSLSDFSNV